MSALQKALADYDAAEQRRRIMIVDAHRESAHILAALLRRLGSDIAITHSGSNATALARSFRPHVVMVDLRLPDIGGLAAALREECGSGEMLLIAVDTWGTPVHWKRIGDAGFDYHLHKPYAIDELAEIVEAARGLPRRAGIFPPPVSEIGMASTPGAPPHAL